MENLQSWKASWKSWRSTFVALRTLNMHSSRNLRHCVSQPYSTTSNIIVLYILFFKFFEGSREKKRVYVFIVFFASRQNPIKHNLRTFIKYWTMNLTIIIIVSIDTFFNRKTISKIADTIKEKNAPNADIKWLISIYFPKSPSSVSSNDLLS